MNLQSDFGRVVINEFSLESVEWLSGEAYTATLGQGMTLGKGDFCALAARNPCH